MLTQRNKHDAETQQHAATSDSTAIRASHLLCDDHALKVNALNLIRLCLAVLVVFSHSFPLTRGSNDTEPLWALSNGRLTLGTLAVDAFFAISGFLIARSLIFSDSMDDYFRKRVLRIYPGFLAAVALSALLALPTVADPLHFLRVLFGRESVATTLVLGYGPLDYAGPSFPGNPFAGVNGSLWTIQYEFIAYAGLAAYGLFGLFRFKLAWLFMLTGVLGLYGRGIAANVRTDHGLEFAAFFMAGTTAYLFREHIPRSSALALVAGSVLAASLRVTPWLAMLAPLAATYLLLYAAKFPVPKTLAWTRSTDLSYGVYLYAFPLTQSLVYWLGMRTPLPLFLTVLGPTLLLALLSWRFVERPALAFRPIRRP